MLRKNYDDYLKTAGMFLGLGALGAAGIHLLERFGFKFFVDEAAKKIVSEPYDDNIFEIYTTTRRTGFIHMVEINMRAESGQALMRPMGTPYSMTGLSDVRFNSAQLYRFPASNDVSVDTALVLGKQAARPMKLDIPILIGGMAYGMNLSKRTKLALAEGASMAGTAVNTGEGPFTVWERAAARHLIVQYGSRWNRDPDILSQADMIEIRIGQAGWAGLGKTYGADELSPGLRRELGLKPGEKIIDQAMIPGVSKPQDLRSLVSDLRQASGGAPVGVKMCCGKDLEGDLAFALEAEVDVIALDGSQAASCSSPAIIQENFGLPTVTALCRATRFLDRQKVRDRVSLLVGGGLTTSGDYLKVMALGADGVYIGSAAIIAAAHIQEFKIFPYEPPTQLLWYTGRDTNKFDAKKGAKHLANYLRASVEEMRLAARALGKTALRDVSPEDLFATDEKIARISNLPLDYQPMP